MRVVIFIHFASSFSLNKMLVASYMALHCKMISNSACFSGTCFRCPETRGMNEFLMQMKLRSANGELSALSVGEIKIDTPSSRQRNVIPP